MNQQSCSSDASLVATVRPWFHRSVITLWLILLGAVFGAAWQLGLPAKLGTILLATTLCAPPAWYLWATSGRVCLSQETLTYIRFGRHHRIQATDLIAVHVGVVDKTGTPRSYHVRGRDGTHFRFTVTKDQAALALELVQHYLETSLATETTLNIGYATKKVAVMILLPCLLTLLASIDTQTFTFGLFLGFIAWLTASLDQLTRINLTPTSLTIKFAAPWRAEICYTHHDIQYIELRQKFPIDNLRATTILKPRKTNILPLVLHDRGNYFTYYAIKRWLTRCPAQRPSESQQNNR